MKNARGVCLLRLGRHAEALYLFRGLVVDPATDMVIPGLPGVYKTNFATALLLVNNVSGCIDVLDRMRDDQNPCVIRLRRAVAEWKRSLNPFKGLFFSIYGDASGRPVVLDFPPGDLSEPAPLQPSA